MSTEYTQTHAATAAAEIGFSSKITDRVFDAEFEHAVFLVGNNANPGAKWRQPGVELVQLGRTNGAGGRSKRTLWAVREQTDSELLNAAEQAASAALAAVFPASYRTAHLDKLAALVKIADQRDLDTTALRRRLVQLRIEVAA